MKKYSSFTLAEVLITLGIIGVIFAFCIIILSNNTNKAECKSRFKKFISTVNIALEAVAVIEYLDFGESEEGSLDSKTSIMHVLNRRMYFFKTVEGADKDTSTMFGQTCNNNYTIFFADGAVLSYPKQASKCTNYLNPTTKNECAAIVDINGIKSPNKLSHCNWNASQGKISTTSSDNTISEGSTFCQETNAFISDQYSVRFFGQQIVPNGYASRYVLYEK